MITQLHIRHFAIIEHSTIDWRTGLTAITGETGAGKSILLDALGLVLGNRASPDMVKPGAERAEVSASFSLEAVPHAHQWLIDHDLDEADECLVRRVVPAQGKSRASINGRPVTVQQLRDLGRQLVSLYGQSEHQRLASPVAQRELLDRFSQHRLAREVNIAWQDWHQLQARREALQHNAEQNQQRADLLRFQLQEFDALDIGGASIDDIENEHRWLASVEQVSSLGARALQALDGDDGASGEASGVHALGTALHTLRELVAMDERLQEAFDLVDSASIQVQEASTLVRQHLSQLEHDGGRLRWLDDTLATVQRLARKHRVGSAELARTEQALRDELDALDPDAPENEMLQTQCTEALQHYQALASELSAQRTRAARQLGKLITCSMQGLALEGGKFEITVSHDPEQQAAHGQDEVQFLVRTNPGMPLASLARVASGGELSRISLALQLATLDTEPVPCLIFDEVDSGVGGAVADTVGRLLRQVGAARQVLCVTHLPQVAAQAHWHKQVQKRRRSKQTLTEMHDLDGDAVRDEIARMLGARTLTAKTRKLAQEMLDSAHGTEVGTEAGPEPAGH